MKQFTVSNLAPRSTEPSHGISLLALALIAQINVQRADALLQVNWIEHDIAGWQGECRLKRRALHKVVR